MTEATQVKKVKKEMGVTTASDELNKTFRTTMRGCTISRN